MTNRIAWGWIVVLFIGCSATPLLDADDDMSAAGSPSSPGTIADACDCLATSCAWPVTECSADPDCARWLTCAEQCPAEGDAWITSCVSSCSEPATEHGRRLRDDLLLCVSSTPGCCGEALEVSRPSEPDGGNYAGDGGGNGGSGGASAPDGNDAVCPGDFCFGCLLAIKSDTDSCVSDGPDPTCSDTISSCYHENGYPDGINHCWRFATRSDCNDAIAGDVLTGDCGYAVPAESEELTTAALRCAVSHCPVCFADANAACFSCQLDFCPDEVRAFMHDVEAQRVLWCFEACEDENDKAGCRTTCQQEHGAGLEVLQLLLACRKDACASACASGGT